MISRISTPVIRHSSFVNRKERASLVTHTWRMTVDDWRLLYAKISVTTPEPTVLPPSRTAKRSP